MKLWRQISSWNLKRKISFFLSLIILTTSMIILAASTGSAFYYMTKQSKEMAASQLKTLASNYDDTLMQYQNLAVAMVINNDVQKYCRSSNVMGVDYDREAGEVYNTLLNMLNVQGNMNFAVVTKNEGDKYVYKGNSSIVDAKFNLVYEKDYRESIPAKEGSTVRISFGNNYFRTGEFTLTLYHPIYSTGKILDDRGMRVMNLNDSLLEQLHREENQSLNSEMFLMDRDGRMVSVSDQNKIGKYVWYMDRITGTSGSFQKDGTLINFQKIGKWNYYLVNEIPVGELYKGSLGVMMILVIIIIGMTSFMIVTLRKMINAFYRPINKVVSVMDHVAEGRLDVRIKMDSMDADSRKLAEGFNSMMDEMNVLMEQVKQEQHEMEQIRFNALHSQIKPHFLYNTLECIHWQAVADGNREISTMVKALAQYYRVCLSQGREIISLRQELEHVRSYLIIQNMRYDNIIELVVRIPEKYYDVKIPKMTLQPLIENAIYHGIRVKEGERGVVEIELKNDRNDICIIVADSGSGMSQKAVDEMNQSISEYDESFGYGVRNVNRRIEIMFGKEYGLHFARNGHGGVTVEIHLPNEAEAEFKGVL